MQNNSMLMRVLCAAPAVRAPCSVGTGNLWESMGTNLWEPMRGEWELM